MKVVATIEARMTSSRLPGKPLCDLNGKPMIQRTYESVIKWDKWEKVYVATDSNRIKDKCDELNIPCLMTSDVHTDCLDRASEVVDILESCGKGGDRYVVIQGDEPLISPKHIDEVVNYHLKNLKSEIILPTIKINPLINQNLIKVITNLSNNVLFLSRAQIPFEFKNINKNMKKHLSIISFKPDALKKFAQHKQTPLEKIEDIELLRALEIGINIKSINLKGDSFSVDIKNDYYRAKKMMLTDKYFKIYKS